MPWPELTLAIAGGIAGWLAGLVLTRHPMMAEFRSAVAALRRAPVAT